MGWTETTATFFKPNGSVDLKRECDELMTARWACGPGEICDTVVVASSLVGKVWYGAVRNRAYASRADLDAGLPAEDRTEGWVVLVEARGRLWRYKEIHECCGPVHRDCPRKVLDALTPTQDALSLAWREECAEAAEERSWRRTALGKARSVEWRATFDSEIFSEGEAVELRKARSGKRAVWAIPGTGSYIPAKYLAPGNCTVLA